MTLSSENQKKLTDAEWEEMNALRKVMSERPQALIPEKMEQFTEYLVRSMKEMGG